MIYDHSRGGFSTLVLTEVCNGLQGALNFGDMAVGVHSLVTGYRRGTLYFTNRLFVRTFSINLDSILDPLYKDYRDLCYQIQPFGRSL